MRVHLLERAQRLRGTPEEIFGFFADAHNLESITPPLLRFEVLTPVPIEMSVGTHIQYRLRLRGVPVNWHTTIQAWEPPHRFVDVQVRGPYALWHHTHVLEPDGPEHTIMRDVVRYAIGFGPLGELAHRLVVRRDLDSIFAFREQAVVAALSPTAAGPTGPPQARRRAGAARRPGS